MAASEYIKLIFSDKSSRSNKVTFIENDIILDKNNDIAEVLKIFFTNAVPKLDILQYKDHVVSIDHMWYVARFGTISTI